MANQRILYTEEMVGYGHPTKADTLNRHAMVQHNEDGTHALAGNLTNATLCAFLAHPAAAQTNFAENVAVTVVLGTERFDQGNNFAANTFTAPVTGKYQLNAQVYIAAAEAAYAYYRLSLITSNKTYLAYFNSSGMDANGEIGLSISQLVDMDAADTAYIQIYADGVAGGEGHDIETTGTFFSGFLVC